METGSVTTKGQLVIPVRLRRLYGIKAGTKIRFVERNGEILMQPVTKDYIRSVSGMLESETSVTGQLLADRAADKEREARKDAKRRSR